MSDGADELWAHFSAVLSSRKPWISRTVMPRVHGQDLVVEAREAPLVLGNQQRLETAFEVGGTSMRSGPSSVSTVLPLLPLRWLLVCAGLRSVVLGRPWMRDSAERLPT